MRGEGLVTQAQILGLAEVLKTSNCRCKNVNWFMLKTEAHNITWYR